MGLGLGFASSKIEKMCDLKRKLDKLVKKYSILTGMHMTYSYVFYVSLLAKNSVDRIMRAGPSVHPQVSVTPPSFGSKGRDTLACLLSIFSRVFGDEKALVTKEARVLMKEKTLLISN